MYHICSFYATVLKKVPTVSSMNVQR